MSHENFTSLKQKDFVEEGNPADPVLLLIHGFPDLWYGWRHQIKVFAEKGYRVIAIDCLGYGETVRNPLSTTELFESGMNEIGC